MKSVLAALAALAFGFAAVLVMQGGLSDMPPRLAPSIRNQTPVNPATLPPVEVAHRELLRRLADYDRLYAINWWPHLSPSQVEAKLNALGAEGEVWLREYYRSPGGRLYAAWSLNRGRFLEAPENRLLAEYLEWLAAHDLPTRPVEAIPRDPETLADFLYPYVDRKIRSPGT